MNNDRFLTRVFDKKEKKMVYPDIDYMAITDRYLLICKSILTKEIEVVPFGDRFVPMMCWGRKGKDGKLIYVDDLVSPAPGSLIFSNEDCVNWVGHVKREHTEDSTRILIVGFAGWPPEECIIKGNRWEHPEIMEAKA